MGSAEYDLLRLKMASARRQVVLLGRCVCQAIVDGDTAKPDVMLATMKDAYHALNYLRDEMDNALGSRGSFPMSSAPEPLRQANETPPN